MINFVVVSSDLRPHVLDWGGNGAELSTDHQLEVGMGNTATIVVCTIILQCFSFDTDTFCPFKGKLHNGTLYCRAIEIQVII